MEEIIMQLNIAISKIQELKFEGTYQNVKNQIMAIEALLCAGDLVKGLEKNQEGKPEISIVPNAMPEEEQQDPEIVEMEEAGNE